MIRPSTLITAALACAACQSLPPLPGPLTVRDPFDARYEGRLAPDAGGGFAVEPAEAAAPASTAPTVSFQFAVVELPLAEVRELVPGLVCAPPPLVEELPGGGERRWGEERVEVRRSRGGSSSPRVRGVGVRGGHVEPHALRDAIAALRRRGQVGAEGTGAVAAGHAATMTNVNRVSFVKALRYAAVTDSLLIDDIEVGEFEYGCQVRVSLARDGAGFRVDCDWRERAPQFPIPTATYSPLPGGLNLPVTAEHRLTAATAIGQRDALVLAWLPGAKQGQVRLLCVHLDAGGDPEK